MARAIPLGHLQLSYSIFSILSVFLQCTLFTIQGLIACKEEVKDPVYKQNSQEKQGQEASLLGYQARKLYLAFQRHQGHTDFCLPSSLPKHVEITCLQCKGKSTKPTFNYRELCPLSFPEVILAC